MTKCVENLQIEIEHLPLRPARGSLIQVKGRIHQKTYDLDSNLTRNPLILENIRISADESICLPEIVDKVFEGIAFTGFEEGAEGGERCEAENGGGDGEKDGEPEIVGEGFEGRGADSKHGNSASISGHESGLKGGTTDFCHYDITLALAEGDLGEARLGMLKDGILRLFA